MNDF
jgi:cyclopropane-fatty-acyl-phospholipid synthase